MANILQEIWKPIRGYEGIYEISSLGRLKSTFNNQVTFGSLDSYGYLRKELRGREKGKFFKLHRIVALEFIPNPENKPQVNHINGVKTDNRVENLEWCTLQENQAHAWRNNLQKTKLSESDVLEIYSSRDRIKKLAEKYGVVESTIKKIRYGKLWPRLTSPLNALTGLNIL